MQSSEPTPSPVDVLIVGAGPVGLACAIAAKRADLDHLLVEKGCLVNSVFHFPVQMTFFTTAELLEIGDHPLITSHEKPTRREALDYYRKVAGVEELRIRTHEEVTCVTGARGDFRVETEGRDGSFLHRARHVILATGYYDHPNRIDIPGEDLSHVSHYYTEAHPFAGEPVLVVGAGNSACEAALDLFRHDVNVTLIHRGTTFGRGVKYWVLPDIENRISAGEIRALFETHVVEIRSRSAVLQRDGETWEEPFEQVFLLTGYHPDIDLLGRCGLRPDPESLRVPLDPETRESSEVDGIYLAGSVGVGRETNTVFIENGRHDGRKIVEHIASREGKPTRSTGSKTSS